MTNFRLDETGLSAMITDVQGAPRKLITNLRKATEVTARNVKDHTKKNFPSKSRYFKHIPRGIGYDVERSTTKIEAQVVSRGTSQSRIIGVVENGSPTTAAKKPLKKALAANILDFQRGVNTAMEDTFE